ncbi:MAG: hypothetical protein L0H70_03005 [Xanthomonadales bacterium]|nr:hypothetical protein [Xanthomonadales bacterium]
MNRFGLICATAAADATPGAAHAATPVPTTYTLLRKAVSAHAMDTAIYRDGARETIKLARANGWHAQMWFDFTQHKQYGIDSNAPGKCSVIAYTSAGAPELLDPVPGAFSMAAEIPANAPISGKATLGGIATNVIQMPGHHGTIWIDPARHMVIKMKVVMEGNPEPQTMIDLTGISFDTPDAKLLTPPAHCKLLAGSANAHGGHAATPIGH